MDNKTIYFQDKKKFFYAIPVKFPNWEYPSRYAISFNFNDFRGLQFPNWEFIVSEAPAPYNKFTMRISRDKAVEIGKKHYFPFLLLPYLVPIEEFEIIKPNDKQQTNRSEKQTQDQEVAGATGLCCGEQRGQQGLFL
jgi:hypothetical protein